MDATASSPRLKLFERYRSDLSKRYPGARGKAPSKADRPTGVQDPDAEGARGKAPSKADRPTGVQDPDAETEERLRSLPPEIGVLLMIVGIAGLLLPGPVGSPFVIAGGLVLWPAGFGRVEDWFRRRFPGTHHKGMQQIKRYLNDLERRYPRTT